MESTQIKQNPESIFVKSVDAQDRSRWIKRLSGFLGTILFCIAFGIIHHELKVHHYHDLANQILIFPFPKLLVGIGITCLNYLVLTGYDGLALRFIGQKLKTWQVAFTAFIAYVFSYNVGLSVFGGTAIRYRIYSAWGISAKDIAKIVAFNVVTLWIGFFTLAGVIFIVEPLAVQAHFSLPFSTVRPIGIIFLGIVTFYLVWSFLGNGTLRLWKWNVSIPPPKFSSLQIIISGFDWLLAGGVLYVLLPSPFPFTFFGFMAVFLLAQLTGLVSHVPGGLGVFESVVLFFFSPKVPANQILTSLIVYRAVYYFIPLVIATALLVGHEVVQRKEGLRKTSALLDKWVWGFIPQLLALSTFIGGTILILSGSTPAAAHRLIWLRDILPLPVVEVSHFLGSLAGVLLLFLAWGLHRRLNAAHVLTSLLLVAGIVFSLFKGIDYEEASILGFMLITLVPSRKYFYRKTSLLDERFTWGWFIAIAAVLLFSIWLGLFSFKHVEYSGDLWWKFEFSAEASRFLRASVGIVALSLIISFARLLRPPKIKEVKPDVILLAQLKPIIQSSPRTSSYLALLGDKRFLLSQTGRSFLMYGVEGRSWVVMGDPVGAKEEWPDLVWTFQELCDEHNGWPAFYEVGHENLYLYVDLGLRLHKLGEEARVRLTDFSLEGSARKNLRYVNNKNDKEGFTFQVIPIENTPGILIDIKNISDQWMQEKNAREKGFSLGFFDEDYLKNFPLAVIEKDNKIVAFANLWPGGGKEELSIDLMRYTPEAPRGVMEYLFIKLMLWGRQEGYQWFNLGMAPLSGLQNHPLSSAWNKIGSFIYRHGEDFYNFEGLREYKDKFDPVWEPRYMASPAGLQLPRIFTNVTTLISGGLKGVIRK